MISQSSSLVAIAAALGLAACAAPAKPAPAVAAAPTPAAPPPAATPPPKPAIAPFSGALASSDAKTLHDRCDGYLADARARLARLEATPRPVPESGVDAVLDQYDEMQADLDTAASISDVVFNANPDAKMRDAGQACEQRAAALGTEISLDRRVYDVLSGLDLAKQDAPTRYWIGQELDDFRRAGVNRDDATRAKIKAMRDELVRIGQTFAKNINDGMRKVELDPKELDGMPADWIAKHPAGPNGKVVVTTQYPDYIPFMTFAKSSAAREKLYRAFSDRAYPQNLEVLGQLLQKRYELATLLGYPNWAAYSMEKMMIRTPTAAQDFIDKITKASEKRADDDYKTLLAFARKGHPRTRTVAAWDSSYLRERLRAEKLHYDAQSVRPYFEFSRVQAGLFDITSRLFGIQYKRVSDAKVWHPDVEVYDVVDGKQTLGRIYLDLHPRPGKYSHAAQFNFVTGKEGVRLPEGVLLCNFPKATADQPALMEHGDVKTFFHEFGHLLQHIFSGHTRWMGTANFHEWDFVEAPSQLLEEWVDDVGTLQTFARHYKTNEPIPADLVERMRNAEEFGRGLDVRRQMVYATVSLSYYDRDPKGLDTTRIFADAENRLTPFKHVPGTFLQASFGHLDGYSSNYYTYMWSLVIAKDLLTAFHAAGLLDPGVAGRYRRMVLEAAGQKPAAELVRDFLGRPFSFDAYAKWLNQSAKL